MRTPEILSLSLRTTLLAALLSAPAFAGDVFVKPPSPSGGINAAGIAVPDGSDSDMYAWDDFTLAETQTITEVRWRGGYALGAPYGKVVDFRISFFDSIASGFQPVITALPEHESQETVIATFHTNNNAGETFVGTLGGVALYDYHFKLPQPVTLQGGVKYWFRVVGGQPIYPDWGMATSTVGSHFKYNQGAAMFQSWPNELSFTLVAQWADLGHGLAGTAGVPKLAGVGTLASGTTATLNLTDARPSSPAWIVAGTTQINLPFYGGTLVPNPQVIVGTSTDATGAAGLTFPIAGGVPPGLGLVMQAWVLDPLAAQAVAASNGLAGAKL